MEYCSMSSTVDVVKWCLELSKFSYNDFIYHLIYSTIPDHLIRRHLDIRDEKKFAPTTTTDSFNLSNKNSIICK